MAAFDWAAMMRVGLGQLGISATEFWQMTPAQLMLLVQPEGGLKPLGRTGFEALQAHFPDEFGERNE